MQRFRPYPPNKEVLKYFDLCSMMVALVVALT